MEKNNITISIVHYFRADRLRVCLNSLGDSFPNIIVWDNNTKGEELNKLKQVEKDFPKVKFSYSEENVGYGKACNQNIINSNTDWVVLTSDDIIFDNDWFEVLNNILKEKSYLEQIYLNSFDLQVIHKKTIVRMGWWDERYKYFPTMDDDDWYLRIVELLGYSPYGRIPSHLENSFPDWYKKLVLKLNYREYQVNSEDNFTYFCNSPFSKYKIIGKETSTGGSQDAGSRNNIESQIETPVGMTGMEYHFTKWKFINSIDELFDEDTLFSKDGRAYKRINSEIDFYPEIRNEYAKKYFNIELI